MRRLSYLGMAITLLTSACSTEPVYRKVTLEAAELPAGECVTTGSLLEVEGEGLPMLMASSRYVVWGMVDPEPVALGNWVPGAIFSVDMVDPMLPISLITEVFVTEEDADADLPDSPSSLVLLRGPLGGLLRYMPVAAEHAEHAMGTAELRDDAISLTTMDLPDLPPGLSYNVWVHWAAGDGHEHGGEGDGEERMELLGEVDFLGKFDLVSDDMLVTASMIAVTIESDNGMLETLGTNMLSGAITVPEGGGDEGGGGHMH